MNPRDNGDRAVSRTDRSGRPRQPAVYADEVWVSFVRASIWLALTVGFAAGGLVALARALGHGGALALATARLHGHVQIVGWAGMMVMGVALHVLPRLFGVPLSASDARRARWALRLFVCGLILRLAAQPGHALVSATTVGVLAGIAAGALILAGALELLGVTLASLTLGKVATSRRPPGKRAVTWPLLLLFATAFGSLWLTVGLDVAGLAVAARGHAASLADRLTRLAVLLGLHGFLVSVGLAMSARLFPLYLRTPVVRSNRLAMAGVAIVGGLALRILAEVTLSPILSGAARLFQAAALLLAVAAIGVFERRRPLPRSGGTTWREPLQLFGVSAYLWLVVAATTLTFDGLAGLGSDVPTAGLDAERHALGAGFVTLLILGVGSAMIPGFAQRRLRSERLRWLTLIGGNLTAALRVVPLLLPTRGSAFASSLVALAGLAAILSVGLFAVNVGFPRFQRDRGTVGTTSDHRDRIKPTCTSGQGKN